jgi:uncharacterized protein (TIGR02217 family)
MMLTNNIFPKELTPYIKGGPKFSTHILSCQSGFEIRESHWLAPLREYSISTLFMNEQALALLNQFFIAHRGRALSFLYQDPKDYLAHHQPLGKSDGGRNTWPFKKTYSAAYERVLNHAEITSVEIFCNGQTFSRGYTLSSSGVTFTTPPKANETITASFKFYTPVRFDTDELILPNDPDLYIEVPLVEVKE